MCYQVADAVELVVGVCSETPDLVYSISYVLRWYSDGIAMDLGACSSRDGRMDCAQQRRNNAAVEAKKRKAWD